MKLDAIVDELDPGLHVPVESGKNKAFVQCVIGDARKSAVGESRHALSSPKVRTDLGDTGGASDRLQLGHDCGRDRRDRLL